MVPDDALDRAQHDGDAFAWTQPMFRQQRAQHRGRLVALVCGNRHDGFLLRVIDFPTSCDSGSADGAPGGGREQTESAQYRTMRNLDNITLNARRLMGRLGHCDGCDCRLVPERPPAPMLHDHIWCQLADPREMLCLDCMFMR